MKPFLQQVAEYYYSGSDISRKCFIFPNRRAMVFFKKYLGEAVAATGKPVMAPAMLSINDFFYKVAGVTPTDRIQLLVDLYDCYKELKPDAEPLDDFIFWGDMLLADFSDVDKYLAEPSQIFTNIAEYRRMQGSLDYLSPKQREALEKFMQHFTLQSDGAYKQRFRQIWDLLLPLYNSFNERLRSQGKAYEGMVYRSVAQRLQQDSALDIMTSAFAQTDCFVFVGLNTLCTCEKKLLTRLQKAGLAQFCWDYRSDWIKDPANKSSFFMEENVQQYPNGDFRPDPEGLKVPEIHVMSVPSAIGQAKQLPQILSSVGAVGTETAIILPDENLLLPVLNSIPERYTEVNVTMGYPMGSSQIWELYSCLAQLQQHIRIKEDQPYFYHRQVHSIFSNPVFVKSLSEEELQVVEEVKTAGKYYIPKEDICKSDLLSLVFCQCTDPVQMSVYLKTIIETIALKISTNADMVLELDFAKALYLAVDTLQKYNLPVKLSTYCSLLSSLLQRTSVPFHGEPLKGLQIMGPLETRVLDFDNVIILSCNEGMYPRHSVGESFIPAELRRGFDLPTYEYQDAMWAYYFYRSIQRAGKVWMLYDSRTEVSRSGEESRYIKQLELHFNAKITKHQFTAPIKPIAPEEPLVKTAQIMDVIKGKVLSASAIEKYLDCQAAFYFQHIVGLRQTEEIADSLEARTLGNAYHECMHELYKGKEVVTRDFLQDLLREDNPALRDLVYEQICLILKTIELTGKNLIYLDLITKLVRKTLERDIEKMDLSQVNQFTIELLEENKYVNIDGFTFVCKLDRLDAFEPSVLRVVDYKTGSVSDQEMNITPDSVDALVKDIFHRGELSKRRPVIPLQLYIYDLAAQKLAHGRDIANCIYQTSSLFSAMPVEVKLFQDFMDKMSQGLSDLLAELANPDVPFARKNSDYGCKNCDFKSICRK